MEFKGPNKPQWWVIIIGVFVLVFFAIWKGYSVKAPGDIVLTPPLDTTKNMSLFDTSTPKVYNPSVASNKKEQKRKDASVKVDRSKNVNVVTSPKVSGSNNNLVNGSANNVITGSNNNVVNGINLGHVGNNINTGLKFSEEELIQLDSTILRMEREYGLKNCIYIMPLQNFNSQSVGEQLSLRYKAKGYTIFPGSALKCERDTGISAVVFNSCIQLCISY